MLFRKKNRIFNSEFLRNILDISKDQEYHFFRCMGILINIFRGRDSYNLFGSIVFRYVSHVCCIRRVFLIEPIAMHDPLR